ncbi:MAG: glycoside hydrolase family 31 protein, partial [Alcaligenaceae bacterium]
MYLDTLKLIETLPTKASFDVGGGFRMAVEPHAPGVYRIRCGRPETLVADILPGGRGRAHAEVLLARPEAIGESVLEPLTGEVKGWQLTQGDSTLELQSSPFQLILKRHGKALLVLSAAGIQGAENFWTLGFELQPKEKIFGLGETHGDLDRRGETILSDDPEHRALPLAWSPNGWGVYINTLGRVEHDLGSENADEYA